MRGFPLAAAALPAQRLNLPAVALTSCIWLVAGAGGRTSDQSATQSANTLRPSFELTADLWLGENPH